MYDDVDNKSDEKGLSSKFDASAKPTMKVDVERYQAYLDGSDLSDAEKAEFLQTLWQIIVSFVDLGFGVHPLQEVCGKESGTVSDGAKADSDGVCSKEPEIEDNPNGLSP
ncbi:hypothetical protein [Tateyamaria pelophila]|uniref:hypothetical protein n=1 Tax=Tateyamaria pelophila TaxID=328415 RepID=UPI001CBDA6E2|nr:hypothetical protein [Tateyamaria pelophila]